MKKYLPLIAALIFYLSLGIIITTEQSSREGQIYSILLCVLGFSVMSFCMSVSNSHKLDKLLEAQKKAEQDKKVQEEQNSPETYENSSV